MTTYVNSVDKRHRGFELLNDPPNKLRKYNLNVKVYHEVEKQKKREIANSNERRRMKCINQGFEDLKECIPNVQSLDKLSKASILSQACIYIKQLQDIVSCYKAYFPNGKCEKCGHEANEWSKPKPNSYTVSKDDFCRSHMPIPVISSPQYIEDAPSSEEKPVTPDSVSVQTEEPLQNANWVAKDWPEYLLKAIKILHPNNVEESIAMPDDQTSKPNITECENCSTFSRSVDDGYTKIDSDEIENEANENPVSTPEVHTVIETGRSYLLPPKLKYKTNIANSGNY